MLRQVAFGVFGLSVLGLAVIRCSDDPKAALVRVVNEAAGADCPAGGFRVLTGLDDNKNGTLEDNEVDANQLSCGTTNGNVAGCDLRPNGYCAGADLRRVFLAGPAVDLRGMDFSGADLRGAIFYNVQAQGANFTGAKLDGAIVADDFPFSSSFRGANFTSASLTKFVTFTTNATFNEANLTEADFSKAYLAGGLSHVTAPRAKFVDANLQSELAESDFTGADFTDAAIFGAERGFTKSKLAGAKFTRAGASYVNFEGADITGADFSFASVMHAEFSGVALAGAAFTNAYYDAATVLPAGLVPATVGAVAIDSASLVGADLRFASIQGTDFSNRNLTNAVFSGNELGSMNFANSVLNGTKFIGATVQANFNATDCSNADFTGAELYGSSVGAGSTFFQTNFTEAGLQGINFGAVPAGSAIFRRATLVGTHLDTITGTGQVWENAYVGTGTLLPGGASGTIETAPGTPHPGINVNKIKLHGIGYNTNADFNGANFSDAVLDNVDFTAANLSNVTFANAKLRQISFPNANLSGANFTGADLSYSLLSNVNLTNANMTNATLHCVGAGVTTSDITLATFTGVTWANTECPDGTPSGENTPATCEGHLINDDTWSNFFCD